jgi:hypothetical protein
VPSCSWQSALAVAAARWDGRPAGVEAEPKRRGLALRLWRELSSTGNAVWHDACSCVARAPCAYREMFMTLHSKSLLWIALLMPSTIGCVATVEGAPDTNGSPFDDSAPYDDEEGGHAKVAVTTQAATVDRGFLPHNRMVAFRSRYNCQFYVQHGVYLGALYAKAYVPCYCGQATASVSPTVVAAYANGLITSADAGSRCNHWIQATIPPGYGPGLLGSHVRIHIRGNGRDYVDHDTWIFSGI